MEDSSITPSESTETQLSESNSLEAPVAEQSVADLSGSQKNYPLETLEVQQEGVKGTESKVEYVPTVRSVPFSKRKAILISIGITLVVVALTAVSLGYLVRENAMDKDSIERNVPTQGVEIDSLSEDLYTKEFSDSQPSLLVDGDIITKGALKVSAGDFMTVFRGQSATADQVISLPALSGELCLSTNNCDFANLADLTAVQNSIVAPTTLNSQDGEVTIQGTSNRINVSTTGSVITITTPQALNTAANVQFSRLSLSSGLVVNAIDSAAGDLVISAANNYVRFVDGDRTFRFPSNGLANQTICTTQNNCNYGTGNGDIVNGGQIGPIIIGTNDASSLSFYTNALNRLNIATNGNIAMNTDTLFVDAVNNRVGIGTSSPVGMLDIVNPTTGQRLVKFTSNSNGYLGAAIVLESSTVARGRGLFLTTTDQASNAWFVGNGYASTDFMIGASSSHSLSGLNGAYRDINSALIIKNATKLIGINTVNPSGQLHVISGSAARQALIVQGATSQTANLQEWQSSTGTILASVSAAGVGSFANLLQNGNQVCDASSNCTNYAPSTGGNGYIQNQTAIPQTAGFNITGNGTIGGNLTVDTNTLTVDATNNRVGIGTAAPSTTLDVSGNVNVSSRLQVGAAEGINECPTIIGPAICDFGIKNINSSSEVLNASYGIFNSLIMTGSSNNAPDNYASLNAINVGGSTTFLGNQIGVNGTAAYSGSGTLGGLIGVMGQAGAANLGNGSVSMIAGLQGVVGGGASTIGSAYGLSILSATLSGGTITNNYGIQVQAQSVGANNYGVAIDTASTQTLWLQGDGGTANTGIGFGSTRDTNLYRSGAGILTTDGRLMVASSANINSGDAANTGLVIQGATSQTANLQEWQSNTGTILASVSAAGVGSFANLLQNGNQVCDMSNNCGYSIGVGSTSYIQNQNAVAQSADFNISGSGTIGSRLDVGVSSLAAGLCATVSGSATCQNSLRVTTNSTETTNRTEGASFYTNVNAPSNNNATNIGISSLMTAAGSSNYTGITGINSGTYANTSGTLASLIGINSSIGAYLGSSVTSATALRTGVGNASLTGNIGSAFGMVITSASSAGNITDNYGLAIQSQTAGSGLNIGAVIHSANDATLWLSGDAGTANTGISFGSTRDTSLYRSAANTLTANGNLNVIGKLAVGDPIGMGSNRVGMTLMKTFTDGSSDGNYGIMNNITVNETSLVNGGYIASISMAGSDIASSHDIAGLIGVAGSASHSGNGNVGSMIGLYSGVDVYGSGTVVTTEGLSVVSINGSNVGSVTDNYGIRVQDQVGAINNYGIAIGAASTQTLWLQGDGGTANTGIGFGSTRDTNLYRSAVNTLTTDGALTVGMGSVINSGSAGNQGLIIRGALSQSANLQEWQNSTGTVLASISAAGDLEVVNATVNGLLTVNGNLALNGHVISGNTSGSTTAVSGLASDCSSTATVNISGNDTAGTVEIITGGGACSPGELATITFANAFGAAPRVTLTPANANAASIQYFNGSATTTTATIEAGNSATPSTTYRYNYQILQ